MGTGYVLPSSKYGVRHDNDSARYSFLALRATWASPHRACLLPHSFRIGSDVDAAECALQVTEVDLVTE